MFDAGQGVALACIRGHRSKPVFDKSGKKDGDHHSEKGVAFASTRHEAADSEEHMAHSSVAHSAIAHAQIDSAR
jgi:hypothetical protein